MTAPDDMGGDAALAAVTEWVTGAGGEVDSVRIGHVDGMRGVIMEREIGALRTELMRVPSALAINDDPDELCALPLGAALGRSGLALLQPDARLALRLLLERSRGDASPWHAYIALLPAAVPCARHLSDAALIECRSDFVLQQAMLARKYAATVLSSVTRLVSEADGADPADLVDFDEAALGWALDMVHSRSFSVDMGARGLRRCMVPLIDMLNNAPGAGCDFTYDETDEPPSFLVELPEGGSAPAVGQQLYLDYGPQTSEELLLMYGFVPAQPTAADVVGLSGAVTAADLAAAPGDEAMREEKAQLLASCRYMAPREFSLSSRRIDPGIVCALRLTFLTPEELGDVCRGNWNRALAHAPVSAANERRVAAALRERLAGLIEQVTTTPEHDALAEQDEELAGAMQLRSNRRELLVACCDSLARFVAAAADEGQPPDESSAGLEGDGAERGSAAADDARGEPARASNLLEWMDDYMPNMRML